MLFALHYLEKYKNKLHISFGALTIYSIFFKFYVITAYNMHEWKKFEVGFPSFFQFWHFFKNVGRIVIFLLDDKI